MLDIIAFTLGLMHFSIPLTYYWYLKRHISDSWKLEIDRDCVLPVTIMIPTYNEGALIERKLTNIYQQYYPKDKINLIIVDSSTDETLSKIKQWNEKHEEIKLNVIEDKPRKGKAHALNTALKYVNDEILVMTDVDSFWVYNSLKECVKYFSDPSVGAVTAIKEPNSRVNSFLEDTYRLFYNVVRVAESKIHSTPIFNGELAAFRREQLLKVGGFPIEMGADDSHTATLPALNGFRAIAVPDALTRELVPSSKHEYFAWRVRRAKHLIQHFSRLMRMTFNAPKDFRKVLAIESFMHLINPWLLIASFVAFITSIVLDKFSFLSVVIILTVGIALLMRPTRKALLAWVVNQLILAYSAIARIRSKELIWRKVHDLR